MKKPLYFISAIFLAFVVMFAAIPPAMGQAADPTYTPRPGLFPGAPVVIYSTKTPTSIPTHMVPENGRPGLFPNAPVVIYSTKTPTSIPTHMVVDETRPHILSTLPASETQVSPQPAKHSCRFWRWRLCHYRKGR